MVQHLMQSVGPAPSRCPRSQFWKHDTVLQQVAMSCTMCRAEFLQEEFLQKSRKPVLCMNWRPCGISQTSRMQTRNMECNRLTGISLESKLAPVSKHVLANGTRICIRGSCGSITSSRGSKGGAQCVGNLSVPFGRTSLSPNVQRTLQENEQRVRTRRIRCSLPSFAVTLPLAMIGELVAAGKATVSTTTVSGHAVALATVTQVAVTAAAFVYGAYFSPHATRPIGLVHSKEEGSPAAMVFEGVDVTGYSIFQDPEVQKAIAYAKDAHAGQVRKTGDPYITHCIQTARILAALVPSNGKRSVNTVIAGVLHDVIDDTGRDYRDVYNNFGEDVAKLVQGVSKLSYINQLLRRHRRVNLRQNSTADCGLSPADVDSLRVMLLGMVNDPRVVLIKLADRLHNMRTIYALPASKASAVAQETLAIWCSLASRLGVWAVKAELEDLCFAVLQPQTFRQLRADLASLWSPHKDWRYLRRITKRAKRRALLYGDLTEEEPEKKRDPADEEELTMQELLEAVVPFDVLVDRNRRSCGLGSAENLKNGGKKTKVVRDAEIALAALGACEEILDRELLISTSYIPGMEVTLSSRLKSLYSTHCKMRRKGVGLDQVYDTRALRVVVGDAEGKLHVAAVEGCYNLLSVVHSLWTPVGGEFDDYIVNPKPSGYQSLHTAVRGPDGAPLEVQIRTKGMHEYAEYGHAAHWLYKEGGGAAVSPSPPISVRLRHEGDGTKGVPELENNVGRHDEKSIAKHVRLGHPALRVEEGRLLAAVVVRVEDGGKELLVAVSFALHAREAVAAGRSGNQRKRWETYARLYKKVLDQWWFAPGHGDWSTCLEKYTLCRDGIYHKQDQFDRSLPTFIQLLDLHEQEQVEYMEVMSIVEEGKAVEIGWIGAEEEHDRVEVRAASSAAAAASTTASRLNNKVRLLRSMLQWEQEVRYEASTEGTLTLLSANNMETVALTEVLVILWPDGEIMRMPAGSTTADAARRMGMDGNLVYLNGHIALPNMKLKDGDLMEIRL